MTIMFKNSINLEGQSDKIRSFKYGLVYTINVRFRNEKLNKHIKVSAFMDS